MKRSVLCLAIILTLAAVASLAVAADKSAPVGLRMTGHVNQDGKDCQFEIVMEGFDRYCRKVWSGDENKDKEGSSYVRLIAGDFCAEESWHWGEMDGRGGGNGSQDGKRTAEAGRRLWTGDRFTGVSRENLGEGYEKFSEPITSDHFPLPCVMTVPGRAAYTIERIEFRYESDPKFLAEGKTNGLSWVAGLAKKDEKDKQNEKDKKKE